MIQPAVTGVGIGLRTAHIHDILTERPPLPWLEVLADNYMTTGGLPAAQLEAVRSHYPVALHCVGMNLGGVDALNWAYLRRIRALRDRMQPAWLSDHVCFTAGGGIEHHDLLPLPYTEEALVHLARRVEQVQEFIGQPLMLENASAYLGYRHSTLSEAAFLNALHDRTGCLLLLDVNNVYVNQRNLGVDGVAYLHELNLAAVGYVHLAGHEDRGRYVIDAHNNPIAPPVWRLFERLQALRCDLPTLIEWDTAIPPLPRLLAEADRARRIQDAALTAREAV